MGFQSNFVSLFKIPVRIEKKIENRRGISCGKERMRVGRIIWLDGGIVSTPKEKGGLAIGNIVIVARNIALLDKWLWRFSNEGESLWQSIVKSIYGVHVNGRDPQVAVSMSPFF